MAANANHNPSATATAAAAPSLEELPVVEVFTTGVRVVVKWGEGGAKQTTAGLSDNYTDSFHALDSNGDEPLIKTFGTLLGCDGGVLTIGDISYRIQARQQQQQQQQQQQENDPYRTPRQNSHQQQQQHKEAENVPFKTPAAPPRNGEKAQDSQSPGVHLDRAADATDSRLLSAARTFCDEMLAEIKEPTVASLRETPKLRDFSKVDLPHTLGRIDMRFSFTPQWPTTPVGKRLCDLLEQEHSPNVILVGKSGCGKTSAIFDAAQKHFCILFTASWKEDEYSSNLASRHDPGGFDESFSCLVSDVAKITKREDSSDDMKRDQVNHCILALVLARMLLLWTFHGNALSWLMYQLTKDMHNKTYFIYKSLLKRENTTLENLKIALGSIEAKMDFFFAVDEAQYGYNILKEKKLWKSRTNPEKCRGIACPLLRELTGYRPVAVAGTAMSLVSVQSCKSDIGKSSDTEVIEDFPSVSLEEITEKMHAILNMEGLNCKQTRLCQLEGRGRLLGGFFSQVAEIVKKNPSSGKQHVFNQAIEQHYSRCLERLAYRIRTTFHLEKQEPDKLLDGRAKKRPLPEGLDIVATASMVGSPVSISHKKIKVDLLHIGLCSVRMVGENQNEFVLDEALGREAVLRVAQAEEFITTTFAKVTELCNGHGGHAMEPLIVAELHDWSTRNPQKTVRDFLSAACGGNLPSELPRWIEEAHFSVAGGCTRKGYKSLDIEDDVQFVEEAVQKVGLRNILLSPSTVKRPDFEAVMGRDGKSPWFLSVSSKLYSRTLDDTSNDDFRSTKPTKFYTQRNGTENKNCCKLRARWETTLQKQQDLFSRCLRIHVCLPEVKRPDDDERRICVDREDGSVVLYITSQNINNIFRKGCLDVLRKLGCFQE